MEKAEFRNESRGIVGAIVIEPGEKPRGIAVKPGESIWLSEEEQVATANAPRKSEDNPFVNGNLALVTEPKDMRNRRPIGFAEDGDGGPEMSDEERERIEAKRAEQEKAAAEQRQREAEERKAREEHEKAAPERPAVLPHQQEQGTVVKESGDGPEGERAQDEEVATPEAKPEPTPKPRAKAKAKA